MTPKIIQLGDLRLEYFVKGDGPQTVICLHGHGRTVDDFTFLQREGRKWVALHLFYHGKSHFPEERIEHNPLSTEEFVSIFKLLLETENISQFHFVAFSQGGRFTLASIPYFGDNIQSVSLISPDGMDNNSFYNKTSRRKWARRLFAHLEDQPQKFIRYAAIAKSMRLMRPKVFAFVEKFAADPVTFKRASLTWRGFRMVQPNEEAIAKTLEEKQIPFKIVMGTYDQVIRPLQAYAFTKRIRQSKSVVEIPCGHNFFKKENIEKFKDLLFVNLMD